MEKPLYVQEIAHTTEHQTLGQKKSTVFIFILATLSVFGLAACKGENKPTQETVVEEQAAVDSLAIALHEVDSILNSGQLAHLDVYEIGKIKNISISVQKASAGDWSTSWINLRKDCGGEYYYSWEDAHLLYDECPYFIKAINTILSNREREVDHEERYAYMTKDDIRVFAYAKSGNAWTIGLSVDYHKQNSTITLANKDVEELINLIQKSQEKINQIQ